MNLIRQGQELIAATLKAHGSETATFRRGTKSKTLALSPAPPVEALGLELGGTRLRRDRREWIFTAADLILPGETAATEPRTGDLIDVVDADGVTRRFRVAPDGDEPEVEAADGFGIMLRVRGALIGTVS